ncbi:MAG: ATP-binding protein, partial [Candidatus Micrarchaeota archaeon]
TGYIEIASDMGMKKKIEEQEREKRKLEEAHRALQAKNEMGSVFVSNVSHELRTPLTNIHGYSMLLADGTLGELNEEQKGYMKVICDETARLTRLINDVLDLSRIDAGRLKMTPKYFDMRELVDKCSCQALAEKKKLYVNWDMEEELPMVYGDVARVSQVLINLISNAIKYTESGGITVKVSRHKRSFIKVDVIDTGVGIPQEDLKNIFKRFYQVPGKQTAKREGTGLGLAIAKEIVNWHKGKIWAESEIGKGSTFTFTLKTEEKKTRKKAEEKEGKEGEEDEREDGETVEKRELSLLEKIAEI